MPQAHRSREQWFQIIEQFNASDLNVATFCRTRHISQASFYQWRKKLTAQSPADQPLFVDITPEEDHSLPEIPAWDIELSLGEGMVLRIRRPC